MKQNNLIEQLKMIHKNKYDYSLCENFDNKSKLKIICPTHGIFEQFLNNHKQGKGCPKCVGKNRSIDEVRMLVNSVHNNKYTYINFNSTRVVDKITIVCSVHGEFEKILRDHIKGSGCPKCSFLVKNKQKTTSSDDFFIKATKLYDNKYIYSNSIFKSLKDKVNIICPTHGEFEQNCSLHLRGGGCPKCSMVKKVSTYRMNNNRFIDKANEKHSNKYNYSLVNYVNGNLKVKIICKEHGEFEQTPASHLNGSGCPHCAIYNMRKSNIDFIFDAKLIHGDKYDYSKVMYVTGLKKIKIICPIHGEFEQTPNNHISKKHGCLKCSLKYDKTETELKDFISRNNISFIENSRNIISPLELDIYIPSHNIAIEFNGLYWHNELHVDTNYHLNKTELCEKQGIKLIHIFEDEWLFKQEIVKSRLKNLFGLTPNKIFGRKTEIKEVSYSDSKEFLDNNHIQGNVNSSIRIGLYYNNELVSLMCFGKGRIAMGGDSNQYELTRFCNKLDTSVIGGADKMLQYFIKTYQPKEIISYADRRWSQGDLYQKLGFSFIHNSKPNYYYIIGLHRKHRFGFRKDILIKEGFDKNKTEKEIMKERRIYRIYDCGSKKYILKLDI